VSTRCDQFAFRNDILQPTALCQVFTVDIRLCRTSLLVSLLNSNFGGILYSTSRRLALVSSAQYDM